MGTTSITSNSGPYNVTVGGMGGGTSQFNSFTAIGGDSNFGDSGENGGRQPGDAGGMGWGNMWQWAGDPNGVQWYCAGGGGGGAGEPGGNASNDGLNGAFPGKGGNGVTWPINGQTYGAGRSGVKGAPNGNYAENGVGWGNYGGGTDGGVIISYVSPKPLWAGGTITTVGDRIFHTFSTSGALNALP
jgi:hypothetical protein